MTEASNIVEDSKSVTNDMDIEAMEEVSTLHFKRLNAKPCPLIT